MNSPTPAVLDVSGRQRFFPKAKKFASDFAATAEATGKPPEQLVFQVVNCLFSPAALLFSQNSAPSLPYCTSSPIPSILTASSHGFHSQPHAPKAALYPWQLAQFAAKRGRGF
jgi:hypothetical protein